MFLFQGFVFQAPDNKHTNMTEHIFRKRGLTLYRRFPATRPPPTTGFRWVWPFFDGPGSEGNFFMCNSFMFLFGALVLEQRKVLTSAYLSWLGWSSALGVQAYRLGPRSGSSAALVLCTGAGPHRGGSGRKEQNIGSGVPTKVLRCFQCF
jgi:hypothetical protein